MNGWMGKILRIDVGTGEVAIDSTEPYVDLGGRGIGLRLICDLLKPGTKPLDPGNPLMFSMGPLTGTALSPQNNLRGTSNFGGYWGPEAKYAGYDHIILTGKSGVPTREKLAELRLSADAEANSRTSSKARSSP
jgi:aldehyde:ferredoxin oxidoreductase